MVRGGIIYACSCFNSNMVMADHSSDKEVVYYVSEEEVGDNLVDLNLQRMMVDGYYIKGKSFTASNHNSFDRFGTGLSCSYPFNISKLRLL